MFCSENILERRWPMVGREREGSGSMNNWMKNSSSSPCGRLEEHQPQPHY